MLLYTSTIVAREEILLTHIIIIRHRLYYQPRRKQNTSNIKKVYVYVITDITFEDKKLFSFFNSYNSVLGLTTTVIMAYSDK